MLAAVRLPPFALCEQRLNRTGLQARFSSLYSARFAVYLTACASSLKKSGEDDRVEQEK